MAVRATTAGRTAIRPRCRAWSVAAGRYTVVLSTTTSKDRLHPPTTTGSPRTSTVIPTTSGMISTAWCTTVPVRATFGAGGNYADDQDDRLVAGCDGVIGNCAGGMNGIVIPGTATTVTLTYWQWYSFESSREPSRTALPGVLDDLVEHRFHGHP